ncbi:MAG: hypothetical protein IJM84_03265 [Bacteroidaceae bacterium]|nr:hypothetical protein [Bacteroidaceae bacterium]MBQ7663612.1 hypothetical protein [Bacteroidaceae bacterium]
MKKNFTLLALLTMFIIGANSALAQWHVPNVGMDYFSTVEDLKEAISKAETDGKPCYVALQNHTSSANNYFSGDAKIESTFDSDGGSTWIIEYDSAKDKFLLKSYIKGQYIQTVYEDGNKQPDFTSDKASAMRFSIEEPGNSPANLAADFVGHKGLWYKTSDASNNIVNTNTVYMKRAGGNANWTRIFTYPVAFGDPTAQQIIDLAVSKYAITNLASLPVGVVGGYDQQLIEIYSAAYEDAIDAQIMYEDEPDYQKQCAAALEEAYNNLMNSRITLDESKLPKAGNYYLVNSRSGETATQISFDLVNDPVAINAAYSDGDLALWSKDFDATVTGENADPKYIWIVENASDTTYTIKNLAFNAYLKNVTANSAVYSLTTKIDEAAKFYFAWASGTTGSADDGFTAVFNIDAPKNLSLHTGLTNKQLINWDTKAVANGWYFVPVSDETIAALQDKIIETQQQKIQDDLNNALSTLTNTATNTRDSGKSYTFAPGTDDGSFANVDGLVTDASQFCSNARELGEGSYAGLLDGKFNSAEDGTCFFHTAWGNSLKPASEPHYLQIDLGQSIEEVILKYATRSNAGTPDIPYEVVVYATNDASKLTKEDAGSLIEVPCAQWDSLGTYTFTYDKQLVDENGNDINVACKRASAPIIKGAGLTRIDLGSGYRYIRLSVRKNVQSYLNNGGRAFQGYVFWNLAELRAYASTYDPECIYENMDPTAKENLNNAIAKAEAELANGKATQATIDELQAAYDAYMAVYPNKDKLLDLIKTAKTWTTPAQTGSEVGNYPDGAVNELSAAISTAEAAADKLTYASYTANMAALESSIETFIKKVVTPEDGIYLIQSRTIGAAKGAYVCTDGTGTTDNAYSNVKWNYQNDTEILNRLNAYWELKNVDGGITLRNLATNRYLSNEQVKLSGRLAQTADAHVLGLRSARVDTIPAALNITLYNDSVKYFANAQPGGSVMVTWNTAKGTDNSAFEFVPVTDFYSTMILEHPTPATIHLLPFDISAPADPVAMTVTGIKDNAVQLEAVSGDIIPAGTPFIVVEDTAIAKNFSVYLTVFDAASIVYDYSDGKLSKNGFTAVWEPETLNINAHVIGKNAQTSEVALVEAAKEAVIPANEGYFVITGMPEAATAGDANIPLVKAIVDGVEKVTLGDVIVTKKGTYSLSGVKVNGNNLPKGVYIIDGKKVVK